MRVLIIVLLAAGTVLPAGDPAGFHFWTHSDLLAAEKKLAPQMDAHKYKSDTMVTAGNHRFVAVHREATGEAEYHEKEADVMFIQSGTATLLYGGTMVDARTTAPGELRGPSIQGGMERKMGPGDVATIPAKIPHQMKLDPGKEKEFNYFVVKVTE
jgi:mannose-6-phosphate isomerase-like protein (cupin superfamily)